MINFLMTAIFIGFSVITLSSCEQKNSKEQPKKEEGYRTSMEQRLATEFTLDVVRIIHECSEADQLLCKSLSDLSDPKRANLNCLSNVYEAKERIQDAKLLVEKWEEKGIIAHIGEEISELKRGIENLNGGCEEWAKNIEKIFANEDINAELEATKAVSKIMSGRKQLFSFTTAWSLRIHHGENKPISHHIQLSKQEYFRIKDYVNNTLSKELHEFEESKDKNDVSWFVFCTRMLDYAISEELKKEIDEENLELTRYLQAAETTDIVNEKGEIWIDSKFIMPGGCRIRVKTRFNKNNGFYDEQTLWVNNSYYEKTSTPRIVTSPKGENFFAFSHYPCNTICCVLEFDKNKNEHHCNLLISKVDE
jgi:hypothetical protein